MNFISSFKIIENASYDLQSLSRSLLIETGH
jgi:hypothetical protein